MSTNQEILEKAIKKAQLGGFMADHRFDYSKGMGWTYVLKEEPKQSDGGLTVNVTGMLSESDIIFNHNFAKALWGEYKGYINELGEVTYSWQIELMKMVISENPIKYLEEHAL